MNQEERLKELFSAIEEGVRNVYSSENYKQYLSFLSKFHSYSFNNTILILNQKPDASLIAGYTAWRKNFNRHVDKGAKAIKILAPYQEEVTRTVEKKDPEGKTLTDADGNILTEKKQFSITRFRAVNVFDISQTSGEPLPTLAKRLEGTSYDAEALIQTIESLSETPIKYVSVENDASLQKGAYGYFSPKENIIVITDDISTNQKAKTLAHEYAHSIMHKQNDKEQQMIEIEAESMAYVLCDHFGIDTSEYSFGYIANYANQDYDVLKSSLLNIKDYAHEYISLLEPEFLKNRERIMLESKYLSPVELEAYASSFILNLEKMHTDSPVHNLLSDYPDVKDQILTIQDINADYAKSIQDKHPGTFELYTSNKIFQSNIDQTVLDHVYLNKPDSHPFIENSIERKNYELLKNIAGPIFGEDVYYLKYTSKGMLDLNIEKIYDDRIAMSHYYVQNGDLMADPDIEISVDKDNKLLLPKTYQLDTLGIYQDEVSNPKLGNELNGFLTTWISNIKDQHYQLSEVRSDKFCYDEKSNFKDLRHFCKENNMNHMTPKRKELER